MLFPPLAAVEPQRARVDGNTLVYHITLSLNLLAPTLEQVLSRRHKGVRDVAAAMNLELHQVLGVGPAWHALQRLFAQSGGKEAKKLLLKGVFYAKVDQ